MNGKMLFEKQWMHTGSVREWKHAIANCEEVTENMSGSDPILEEDETMRIGTNVQEDGNTRYSGKQGEVSIGKIRI